MYAVVVVVLLVCMYSSGSSSNSSSSGSVNIYACVCGSSSEHSSGGK